MLLKYALFCGLIIMVALGCNRKTSNTVITQDDSLDKIKVIAQNNFTNPYELLYSKDSSYVCIYDSRKVGANGIFTTNSFVLYTTSSDNVVFKGQHNRVSKMSWIDKNKFRITTAAGMIKDNESGITHHYYNMTSGEKYSKEGK